MGDAMMELTPDQARALRQGEAMAIDPETKEEYVLVRKADFDRLRHLFEDDLPSKQEVAVLVEQARREYDENDPTLQLYQND
jgi:hypothetical protein